MTDATYTLHTLESAPEMAADERGPPSRVSLTPHVWTR